jgi:hypothetical protein
MSSMALLTAEAGRKFRSLDGARRRSRIAEFVTTVEL